MTIFQQLFPDKKAVIAMLHLKGNSPKDMQERTKREISLFTVWVPMPESPLRRFLAVA